MIDTPRSFALCFAKILNSFQAYEFCGDFNIGLYSTTDDQYTLIHNLKSNLSPLKLLGFCLSFLNILALAHYALKRNRRVGQHLRRFANVSQCRFGHFFHIEKSEIKLHKMITAGGLGKWTLLILP